MPSTPNLSSGVSTIILMFLGVSTGKKGGVNSPRRTPKSVICSFNVWMGMAVSRLSGEVVIEVNFGREFE